MSERGVAEWTEELRRFAAACRAARPLPDRATLTLAQEWQCRIVGGALLAWLREHGRRFLHERAAMAKLLEVDPDPTIVFTSDVPGLVAAQEILGPDHERVVCLLAEEFADAKACADDAIETPYFVMEGEFVRMDVIGLVPEGLRLDSYASGVITDGLLAGATTTWVDYLLYRHDGVGVLYLRGFAVHPDGVTLAITMKGFIGEPSLGMLEAMLDPEFEFPDVDIPLHGAGWLQTMALQYAFVNHTVFGCTGTVNPAQGEVRFTCRSLAP